MQKSENVPTVAGTAEVAEARKKQVKERNIFRLRGMPDIPLLVIILILVGFRQEDVRR